MSRSPKKGENKPRKKEVSMSFQSQLPHFPVGETDEGLSVAPTFGRQAQGNATAEKEETSHTSLPILIVISILMWNLETFNI